MATIISGKCISSVACRMLLVLSIFFCCSPAAKSQCTDSLYAGRDTTVCLNTPLSYTATTFTTANVTAITWNTIPATTAYTGTTFTVPTSVDGTFSYAVHAEFDNGCFADDTIKVTVSPYPVASFSFSPNNQCGSEPVTFVNTSSGIGLSYFWNFGDPNSGEANTSTSTSPTHRFIGTPGVATQTFTVTLIVTSSGGCSDTITQQVTTRQSPGRELGGTGKIVYNGLNYFTTCSNSSSAEFTFTNLSSTSASNTNYRIVWGDGSPDFNSATFDATTHTYNTGTYTLLFIVSGGAPNFCVDTATYYVFLGSNPAVGLNNPGNTTVCSGSPLTFPITGTFGNPPGTTYTVTFNDNSPQQVFTHPAPAGVSHTFLISSCGTTSSDGTNIYNNSFSAVIVASNPCGNSSSGVVPIYVSQTPEAIITVSPNDTVCVNRTITFTNASSGNSVVNGVCNPGKPVWSISPATGWSLVSGTLGNDFGISDPSVWQTGSDVLNVNFTVPGIYQVKLKIGTSSWCATDEIIQTICVNPVPVANFLIDQNIGCGPLTVKTTNNSNSSTCGANTFNWSVTYVPTAGCTPAVAGFSYINGTSSTSANPEFLFTNPGVYTITLVTTAPAGACSSTPFSREVTVKSKPVVTLNPFATICENESITPVLASSCYVTGATYSWTFPSGSPAVSASQNPGTITFTNSGIYNISVDVTNECGTTNVVQPLTVTTVTAADAGPAQSLCGTTVTMAANTPTLGTGTWSVISGPNIPTFANANSPNTTITGLVPGNYLFEWTISNGNCVSSSTVSVTIVNGPTPAAAGPDQNLCLATSATLAANTPTIGTGAWTFVSGPNTPTITDPSLPNTTVTGLVPGVYTLRWTISFGNCTPSTDDVVITIYDNPSPADAGQDQTICSPSVTMSGNAPTTGNGTWSLVMGPNTPTITDPSLSNTTITGLVPGNYTFRWTTSNGNCAISTDDVQIFVNPFPTTANAGPDQRLCTVTSITLAGNTAVVGTGNWSFVSGPNTPTITDPSLPNSTVTGLVPGTYIFRWSISNGVCTPSTDDVQIIIDENATVADAGADQHLCGTSVTMAGNNPSVGTGTWTLVSGPNTPTFTNASQSNTPITGLTVGTYIFRWTISNGSCSSADDVQVIIASGPTPAVAGPDQELCLETSTTLAGNTPTLGTGTWTLVNGPNTPTITDPSLPNTTVTGLIVGTYTFRWTTTFANCTPSTDDVTITVYDNPTVSNAGDDQTICDPVVTMSGNNPAIGTGTWTLVNGPNTPTFTDIHSPYTTITDLVPGNYTFRWTIANGVCDPSTDDVVISVNPFPTTAVAGPAQELCNVSNTILAGNNPTVGTGTWTFVNGPNTPTITDPSLFNTTVTGLVVGTYTFRWTITNGVCTPSTDDVVITIYDNPTVSNAGDDQTICDPVVTMSGNNPAIGTGTWTLVNGPNTPTITDIHSPYTTITGLIPGDYTFRWTIVNGVCAPSTDDVVISVNPFPTTANAGQDQVVCNVTTFTLAGNTALIGTGEWTFVSGPNVPVITNPALPNTTVTGVVPGTYIFRWTITNGVCTPSTDDVEIKNLNDIDNQISSAITVICSGQPVTITGNNPAGGNGSYTYQWEQSTDGNTWTVIPGATSQNYTSTLTGSLYFRRKVTSLPCENYSNIIFIQAQPPIGNNTIAADQSICINTAPATLTGSTPTGGNGVYNYQWQISIDGGNTWNDIPSATDIDYTPGVLSVPTMYRRLVSTDLCAGPQSDASAPVTISINQDAKALFSATPMIACAPFNLNSSVTVTPFADRNGQYLWYADGVLFGSNTTGVFPGYTISNPGDTVIIKLVTTSQFGCKPDSMEIEFITVTTAVAGFTKSTDAGCGPLDVTFTNTSSILDNSIQYFWNFGNGITANGMNPSGPITYLSHPDFRDTTYYITLKAYNGCDTTYFVDSVKVFPNSKARFGVDTTRGCSPFTIRITNTSPGNNTAYYWDFGDGTTDTTFTNGVLNHTFFTGTITTYTIRLISENQCTRDTQTINIVVSPNEIQPFVSVFGNQLSGCAPHVVTFSNSSVGASQLIWDFGDNSPLVMTPNNQNLVSHTYTAAGNYTVIIRLQNDCSDTVITRSVQVYDPPTADFNVSPAVICTGQAVSVTNTSLNANSYEWSWDDNSPLASFVNGLHTYHAPGDYTIRLVATRVHPSGFTCTDTATKQVTVLDKIPAKINVGPGRMCEPYMLNVDAGNITNYKLIEWVIYDSSSAQKEFRLTGLTASHLYQVAGSYSVKLIVHTTDNCVDSTTYNFTVARTPKTTFTPTLISTCNHDTTVTFTAITTYAGNDPVTYKWFINNSIEGTNNPFTYQFQVPLNSRTPVEFEIKALAENPAGCGDTSLAGKVIVKPLPIPAIVVSPSMIQQQPDYTFTFTDTAYPNPTKNYLWDMGDRSRQTRNGQQITYEYGDTGTYKVKLLVTDFATGCYASDSVTVSILGVPGYLYVPNAMCLACSNNSLRQFLPLGKGLRKYKLTIYTAWGQKIFETTSLNADGSPNEPWDGKMNGKVLQQDAYTWQIEATYINGTEWKGMLYPGSDRHVKAGFITVIK
jgi:PKD repeat protein